MPGLKYLSIRKLRTKRSPELLKALLQFRNEMKNVPYETDAVQFVKSAYDGPLGRKSSVSLTVQAILLMTFPQFFAQN